MRLNREQIEAIKDKLGVDRIWSFSKMSTFEQCTWSYKLKYIDKLRSGGDSCYTYWGTIAHDIRQGFYEGEYASNEEMLEKLESHIATYLAEDKKELKFPNENEHNNYFNNLRHYFANCSHVTVPVTNEKLIIAVLQDEQAKFVFQGYMDSFYNEDGKNYILDYKTSSMSGFTGEKLMEKSQQLMVYAYGLWKQQGIPIETIVLRFDMMKYCHVKFIQKNGKEKVTRCERRSWVAQLSNQLRKDFEDVPKLIEAIEKKIATLEKKKSAKCRTEQEIEELTIEIEGLKEKVLKLKGEVYDIFQINDLISEAIDNNNLECLPQFIQDKYKVEECFIDVELNEDIIEQYISRMIETLKLIVSAEEGEHENTFNRSRIEDKESYFCNNLCDVRDSCKFYKEYKEHGEMFMHKKEETSDDLILKMLGL